MIFQLFPSRKIAPSGRRWCGKLTSPRPLPMPNTLYSSSTARSACDHRVERLKYDENISRLAQDGHILPMNRVVRTHTRSSK